jgi:hypothetical protein
MFVDKKNFKVGLSCGLFSWGSGSYEERRCHTAEDYSHDNNEE